MNEEQKSRLEFLRDASRNRKLSPEGRVELSQLHKIEKQEEINSIGVENYNWLTDLLCRHDPIKLTKFDAPKDEYEYEARMILSEIKKLNEAPNAGQLLEMIHEVFVFAFGIETAGRLNAYFEISEEVMTNMEKLR